MAKFCICRNFTCLSKQLTSLTDQAMRVVFMLLIIIGIMVLLGLFTWLILIPTSQVQFYLIVVLTIISMVTILCGFSGLRQLKEGREL
jgi:hypothetical protein